MKGVIDKAEFRTGWRTLVASIFGNGSGLSGLAFYTFGVFVVPLSEAFGWSRGQISIAASFLIIGTAFTAPIVGALIDRVGARKVAIVSLIALSLGYVGLTQLGPSILWFYAAWLLVSLIGGGTTPVVWTRAVILWFDRSRGLSLGLTLSGAGLAGIFGPLACTLLIQRFGWQAGYLGVGAFLFFVTLPIIIFLLRDKPRNTAAAASLAQQASEPATTVQQTSTPAPQLTGMTFHEGVRTVAFWKIAIGFFFVSAAVAGLIINLVPLLISRGMTNVEAAQIAGFLGIAVLFGRVGVGLLLDRFPAPQIGRLLLGGTAIGCWFLSLAGAPTWVAVLSVMCLGLAAAAEVDLVAYLSSRYFGMLSYGKIYGWQLTSFYLGAAIGPLAMGLAVDRFDSYTQVLYVSCGILLFGALVVGSLGKPPEFSSVEDEPVKPLKLAPSELAP